MNVKRLSKILMLFSVLLLFSGISAAFVNLTVTAPAADTYVSGYYTMTWLGGSGGAAINIADKNTLSCYADMDSSGYDKTQTITTGYPCCDKNELQFSVAGWTGRPGGSYYLWCLSDQNTDMNAYSSNQLILQRFGASDIRGESIDVVGGVLGGVANNAVVIGVIIAIMLIVGVLVVDVLTGIFGIFDMFKGLGKR